MRYGRFALDVAAIVPFFYLLAVLGLSDGQGYRSKWVNVVSLVRLLRLLRLISVSKVIYIDSALGRDGWLSQYLDVTKLYALMVGYQIAVLVNLLACVLLLIAFLHGPEDSWMGTRFDLLDASQFYQWYCAIYWVLTTATTTGYGDVSPTWWGEQVVANVRRRGRG
ncbi:Potassium channel KAT2 [Tetrabaena socialis]|uniref:Potassium channel KAT2 n=1 Tax=Tetrabaena socialis TaxID=47790 RepID=A0A2J8A6Q4_9CHLO|nr:Potassium channel KAT2 [Tetrabaena socialis]|eukprot:PNH08177.1 Potassium channel KAT2 [Tetrabaena socialis]